MFIRWLLHWLRTIWAYMKNEEPDTGAVSLSLKSSSDTSTFEGYEMKKPIEFTGAGTDSVHAVFRDAAGNETTAHGAVVFTSTDETIATVTANEDGVSAVVTGTGKIGTCTIVATDEKDHASDIATVITVAGEAVSLELEEVAATTDSAAPAVASAAASPELIDAMNASDPAPAEVTESAPVSADTATATTEATATPVAESAPTADADASTGTDAAPADAPADTVTAESTSGAA